MSEIVDLRRQPYCLTDAQIQWVESTLEEMTLEERISQLFFCLFYADEDQSPYEFRNEEILEKYAIGGARYFGGNAAQVQSLINTLQKKSRIPLLVAANCDSGGNGACTDGTYIASAAQCEAAHDLQVPFDAGLVSGIEARALGVNVNFGPCADILTNWRNTIINTRAYGTTPDTVLANGQAYIRGLNESGVLACAKHFPGDGDEERDQHLVLGTNSASPENWRATVGHVYRSLIDDGIPMVMAGHIAVPAVQKELDPRLRDEDVLPATLDYSLITTILKEEFGFNGLVVTDASHMLGLTSSMARRDYVPRAIAAGCDMFLFFNDIEEDFQYMLDGHRRGIISEDRLLDANRRILGLKALLNLPDQRAEGTIYRSREDLTVIGAPAHRALRRVAADKSITLVKNTLEQLPLNVNDHRRVRLFYLTGEADGLQSANSQTIQILTRELESRGYEVSVNDGTTRHKGSIEKFRDEVDAALIIAEVIGYGAQNNYRIEWKVASSTDCPWYVHEVPTFMVSFNYTTHLHDVSMVKCLVNAYKSTSDSISLTIDKLEGTSPFLGGANELVWADKWQARI